MFPLWLIAQASDLAPTDIPLRGWEAISAGQGISVAVTGMLIVFAALSIIALFVAKLPAMLAVLDPWLPEMEAHAPPTPAEQMPIDEEKIVAAIGFALHQASAAKP